MRLRNMLKICLAFWKIDPQYAYKRYAYKKNMCLLSCWDRKVVPFFYFQIFSYLLLSCLISWLIAFLKHLQNMIFTASVGVFSAHFLRLWGNSTASPKMSLTINPKEAF